MKLSPSSPSAQAAFVNWLNLFPLDSKVTSIDDLSDGLVLAKVLEDMDPSFRVDDLNRDASTWLEKKANLEAVFRNLDKYTCQDNDSDLDWLSRSYKPKDIAHNPDTDGLCEALAVFVYVAMAGPNRERHIGDIQSKLEPKHQGELAAVFRYKQHQSARSAEAQGAKPRDRELELEEEKARLHADMDALQKQNADLLTRLERLHMSNQDLKEINEKLREEAEEARKLQSGNSDGIIMKLEEKVRDNEELISRQEQQIEEDKMTKIRLSAELAQLRKQTEHMTALQDEVSELRHTNEELSKKANAAERYKQKLESQHGIEKDLKNLQYELDEARKDQGSYQALRAQVEAQTNSIVAYRRMQEETELHLNELRTQKNQFAELLAAKTQELDRLLAQRSLDEKLIDELREQITSDGLVRRSPSPEPSTPKTQLDGDDPAIGLRLELSRLKAENAVLRNSMGVQSSNEQLRAELELSKRNSERLTDKLHELRADYAASQQQLQALMDKLTDDGSEAFVEMHTSLRQAREELAKEKDRARALEAELKDSNRELLALKTDYKVATKDSIDALQELKATDGLISASLQDELKSLRRDYEKLQVDSKEQQKQLMDSLLSAQKLRKDLDEAAARDVRAVDEALGSVDRETNSELTRKHVEKTEKLKAALHSMRDQLQKADQERYELQRRLRAVEQGGAYAALKAANEQTIKNLQRENAMISTAWYDLTSRLQSNHVVLQRRQDMPRTWINKQRQMINATPRR